MIYFQSVLTLESDETRNAIILFWNEIMEKEDINTLHG